MKIPLEESADAKFAMAPMIDMVFLLLVFFMCASHLSTVQSVELEIPTATKAVVPKERPDRFVINVDRDGLIYGGNVQLTLDQLKAMVTEHKEAAPALKVYLRADQQTSHRHVKKVMGVMAELGIDDFIFGAFIPNE
jgi:biopolymer transport protein ExbD